MQSRLKKCFCFMYKDENQQKQKEPIFYGSFNLRGKGLKQINALKNIANELRLKNKNLITKVYINENEIQGI